MRNNIRDVLKRVIETGTELTTFVAEIIDIDDNNFITVRNDLGREIMGCLLLSDFTGSSFYQVPEIGSLCIVNKIGLSYYVSSFSNVSEVYLKGGSNGGLIKISALVDRLNQLENQMIALRGVVNTHTHPFVGVGPGNSGTTIPTTGLDTGSTTLTKRDDLENDKVKH
jgi:hypothetical protein